MPRGQQKIGNFDVPPHHEFPRLLQWLVSSDQASKYELQYFGSETLYASSAKSVLCEPGQKRRLGNVSSLSLICETRQETIVDLVESAATGTMKISGPIIWIQLTSAFQAFDQAGDPIVDPWTGKKIVFYDYTLPSGQIIYAHDQLRSWYEAPFLTPIEQHLSLFVKSLEQPTFKPVTRSEVKQIQKNLEALAENKPFRDSAITQAGDIVSTHSKRDKRMNLCKMIANYMELNKISDTETLARHLLETVSRVVGTEPSEQTIGSMSEVLKDFIEHKIPDKDHPGYPIAVSHLAIVLRHPESGEPFYGNTKALLKFHEINCVQG